MGDNAHQRQTSSMSRPSQKQHPQCTVEESWLAAKFPYSKHWAMATSKSNATLEDHGQISLPQPCPQSPETSDAYENQCCGGCTERLLIRSRTGQWMVLSSWARWGKHWRSGAMRLSSLGSRRASGDPKELRVCWTKNLRNCITSGYVGLKPHGPGLSGQPSIHSWSD